MCVCVCVSTAGDAARLGWNSFFGLPLVPCLGEEEFLQVSPRKNHAIQLVPGQGWAGGKVRLAPVTSD